MLMLESADLSTIRSGAAWFSTHATSALKNWSLAGSGTDLAFATAPAADGPHAGAIADSDLTGIGGKLRPVPLFGGQRGQVEIGRGGLTRGHRDRRRGGRRRGADVRDGRGRRSGGRGSRREGDRVGPWDEEGERDLVGATVSRERQALGRDS